MRRSAPPPLRSAASVALLCAHSAPYVRAAVDAGAGLVGLRVLTYGPDEVARLGDTAVAGERLGALHLAVLGVGLSGDMLAALAARSAAPVVDAGGPDGDPVGALADIVALHRALSGLEARKLAWVGDSCGLTHDLLVAGASLGLSVAIAHPVGFAPGVERLTCARERAAVTGAAVTVTTDLEEAVTDAHAIYVDPWPADHVDRFRPYAVQRHLLRRARAGCVLLHRAPERRGSELSASLIEEPGWLSIEQSRTRADAWAAVLSMLVDPDPLRHVLTRSR